MPRKTNENKTSEELSEMLSEEVTEDSTEEAAEDVTEEVAEKNSAGTGGPAPKEDDGYVEYTLPFLPGVGRGDFQTVTLNGRNYQVKYGEPVRIPKGVKEILERMIKGYDTIEENRKSMQEEKCIATVESK